MWLGLPPVCTPITVVAVLPLDLSKSIPYMFAQE